MGHIPYFEDDPVTRAFELVGWRCMECKGPLKREEIAISLHNSRGLKTVTHRLPYCKNCQIVFVTNADYLEIKDMYPGFYFGKRAWRIGKNERNRPHWAYKATHVKYGVPDRDGEEVVLTPPSPQRQRALQPVITFSTKSLEEPDTPTVPETPPEPAPDAERAPIPDLSFNKPIGPVNVQLRSREERGRYKIQPPQPTAHPPAPHIQAAPPKPAAPIEPVVERHEEPPKPAPPSDAHIYVLNSWRVASRHRAAAESETDAPAVPNVPDKIPDKPDTQSASETHSAPHAQETDGEHTMPEAPICPICRYMDVSATLQPATVRSMTYGGGEIDVAVMRCPNCGRNYITQDLLKDYQTKHGILLSVRWGAPNVGHADADTEEHTANLWANANTSTILSRFGYVAQEAKQSEKERHAVIDYLLDNAFATKDELLKKLRMFVRTRGKRCYKAKPLWEGDIEYIERYGEADK